LVLPGSRARIVRCGGRYDPQLVKRSSEWVSEPVPPGVPAPTLHSHLLWRFAIQQQSTAPQSGHALLTQDVQLNSTMRLISSTLRSTPLPWLPVLSNIEPPALQRKAATDELLEKIVKHDSWPMQPDILNPPLLRLASRKPLWLKLQPVDIKSRWRHNWKSAQVVNSHLVCDHTIRQPGFDHRGNSGLCLTVFARNRDTAVPAEGNGDL